MIGLSACNRIKSFIGTKAVEKLNTEDHEIEVTNMCLNMNTTTVPIIVRALVIVRVFIETNQEATLNYRHCRKSKLYLHAFSKYSPISERNRLTEKHLFNSIDIFVGI